MPQVVNAAVAYQAISNIQQGNVLLQGQRPIGREQAVAALQNHWGPGPGSSAQFDMDVAMWYGALTLPGNGELGGFLTRLFSALYRAGIRYNITNNQGGEPPNWCYFGIPVPGAVQGIPVASALSHGGRIIFQLPMRTGTENPVADFRDWLMGDLGPLWFPRSAATHAMAERAPSTLIEGDRRYRLKEQRGKAAGLRGFLKGALFNESNHFGVNVPLGGFGNTNWFSGNRIDSSGDHGHIYIYFNEKEPGQCGTIMIGCENSAPSRTSQTGVVHNWQAISEEFSPCGTMKWPDMQAGPRGKAEAMLVDLSDGWAHLQGQVVNFTPALLGHTPLDPDGALGNNITARLRLLYAMKDVLDVAGPLMSRAHRQGLEAHFQWLLNTADLSCATLNIMAGDLARASGKTGVTSNAGWPNWTGGGRMMPLTVVGAIQRVRDAYVASVIP